MNRIATGVLVFGAAGILLALAALDALSRS
jgi:hypothetical protein